MIGFHHLYLNIVLQISMSVSTIPTTVMNVLSVPTLMAVLSVTVDQDYKEMGKHALVYASKIGICDQYPHNLHACRKHHNNYLQLHGN